MKDLVVDNWRVIPTQNRIRRHRQTIELQPRCMALLAYLAQRPGEVVGREELFEQVWAGRVVGEDALNNCVRKLRRALDDDARQPRIIETIPGRGYRLKGRVRAPTNRAIGRFGAWMSAAALALVVATVASSWEVSVYRFSEQDSRTEREAKFQEMMGQLEKTESPHHAIALRTHGSGNPLPPAENEH